MKRCVTLVLALTLSLALALPALADVIYEPEDDFYRDHAKECSYENRFYLTNGPEGYVTAYTSPVSDRAVVNTANGTETLVSYVWEGGWGLATLQAEGEWVEAWLPMEEMVPVYDSRAFMADHSEELTSRDEPLTLDLTGLPKLVLWPYPGAEKIYTTLDLEGIDGWMAEEGQLDFTLTYEDAAGRSWGYIGYLYGMRDKWVCLSAPDAGEDAEELAQPAPDHGETEEPAGTPAPSPTLIPAAEVIPPVEKGGSFPWLPVGLGAGVVVIAGALLALFRKKK